jgi:hypothetical protein
MRVWGRTTNELGVKTWVEVSTDANGNNDGVFLTALAQVLKLNLNESPFFANFGIPQQQTIITQVYPDFYVNFIQTQYSSYFAALSITRVPLSFPPSYQVNALTHSGAIIDEVIPT